MARERPPFQGFTPERREKLITLLAGTRAAHRESATATVSYLEDKLREPSALVELATKSRRRVRARTDLRRALALMLKALESPLVEGVGLDHDLRDALLIVLKSVQWDTGLVPSKGGRPKGSPVSERNAIEWTFFNAALGHGSPTRIGAARALRVVLNDVLYRRCRLVETATPAVSNSARTAVKKAWRQYKAAIQAGGRLAVARKRQEAQRREAVARALRRLLKERALNNR